MTGSALKGRLAVVTGATGGMGSAVASLFADQGAQLLLCDINQARLDQTAAALKDRAQGVEVLAHDIAAPDFTARLLAAIGEREIAALVHTAGLSPTMADGPRIMTVNYDASERLVEAVRPKMAAGACAVLISSCSAHMVVSAEIDAALKALKPGEGSAAIAHLAASPQSAYPVSKRAVIQLVARQAGPFGERGARIASISPGLIDTGMGKAEQAASPQMDQMLAKTPLARFGHAEEIATAAAFLCSPAASFISGCDLRVDGGVLAALGL
jgi:NAD(P)-dependent dehydrogenase (short-subunit alcohol dehydrogenase family)